MSKRWRSAGIDQEQVGLIIWGRGNCRFSAGDAQILAMSVDDDIIVCRGGQSYAIA
jgi:hypothetical protein